MQGNRISHYSTTAQGHQGLTQVLSPPPLRRYQALSPLGQVMQGSGTKAPCHLEAHTNTHNTPDMCAVMIGRWAGAPSEPPAWVLRRQGVHIIAAHALLQHTSGVLGVLKKVSPTQYLPASYLPATSIPDTSLAFAPAVLPPFLFCLPLHNLPFPPAGSPFSLPLPLPPKALSLQLCCT